MSLALLFHYLLPNMFRMLIHPSSGACVLFDEFFNGLYCSGSVCVGVTLWLGWGGVVSVCRLKHCFSLHTDTTTTQAKPQRNTNTHRTRDWACIRIPHHPSQTTMWHQNTWNQNNTTHEITQQISRKLLRMDILTSETCLAVNNEII